jgi:hypothetical protein
MDTITKRPRGRPKGIIETRPRQPRIPPEVRAEIVQSMQDRLRAACERAVDLWAKIMDDPNESTPNRIAASDRLAAYGIGKPVHREVAKDSDADAVRAITEARRLRALEGGQNPAKALPPAPVEVEAQKTTETAKPVPPKPVSKMITKPADLTPLQRFGYSMDGAIRR